MTGGSRKEVHIHSLTFDRFRARRPAGENATIHRLTPTELADGLALAFEQRYRRTTAGLAPNDSGSPFPGLAAQGLGTAENITPRQRLRHLRPEISHLGAWSATKAEVLHNPGGP
jgi:hypothetical protein